MFNNNPNTFVPNFNGSLSFINGSNDSFIRLPNRTKAEEYAEGQAKSGHTAYVLEAIKKYSPSHDIFVEELERNQT